MTEKKTVSMTANVRPEIRDKFRDFCRDRGRVQADMLGKTIEWIMALDKTTLSIVMMEIEDRDAPALADVVLRRIAQTKPKAGRPRPAR